MLSIIMPYYKKFQEFVFAMKMGNLETFNSLEGLELVLVLDDPGESQELLSFLDDLKVAEKINFSVKVLLNEEMHEWRAPSAAINVGIKNATYEKMLVISPETMPLPRSIEILLQSVNDNNFALGIIKFSSTTHIEGLGIIEAFNVSTSSIMPYGSICFTKAQAEKVGGYDESYIKWGGDDDDYRARLVSAGYSKKQTLAKFLHGKLEGRSLNRPDGVKEEKTKEKVLEKLFNIKEKQNYIANNGQFGNSFNKVVFEFKCA